MAILLFYNISHNLTNFLYFLTSLYNGKFSAIATNYHFLPFFPFSSTYSYNKTFPAVAVLPNFDKNNINFYSHIIPNFDENKRNLPYFVNSRNYSFNIYNENFPAVAENDRI